MSLQPKPKAKPGTPLSWFSDSGVDKKKLSLIRAAYFDNYERAKAIVKADPDQINSQDPFAGLTPLHIAIFRQNDPMVTLIATHPTCDFSVKDHFGRVATDMLIYIRDRKIFETVMQAAYPHEYRAIEDEPFDTALASGRITPMK